VNISENLTVTEAVNQRSKVEVEAFNNGFAQGVQRFEALISYSFAFLLVYQLLDVVEERELFSQDLRAKLVFWQPVMVQAAFVVMLYLVFTVKITGKTIRRVAG